MGNNGSKGQLSKSLPKTELNILLLGRSRTGKSLFFYEINKIINNDDNYIRKCEVDQQKALSYNLNVFRKCILREEEEEVWSHLTQSISKLIPNETIDTFLRCGDNEKRVATWPCLEIWKEIFNNAYLRNLVDNMYREGIIPDNFYYLFMEKILKGKVIYEENCYQYCYFRTLGIVESMGYFNNLKINALDVGDVISQRKKWLNVIDYQDVIFFTISLVNFDDILLSCETPGSRYVQGKKKILLFTKADLLPTILRNGDRYTRKLDFKILPELVYISNDYNMRNIVNSIVSLCIERIGRENFDSFHLISSLSSEDVKNVLLLAVSNERRNTVSKCLCYSTNNFSNNMLQYCWNGKCTDIQIKFE